MCKLLLQRFVILLCCLSFSYMGFSQLEPVKWTFEVEKINAQEYDLIFTAKIERGWSVYSQYLESQQGPIPTSFEFDQSNSIQLIGNTKEVGNKKEAFDQTFGIKLVKFSNKARFTQRVKVEGPTDIVNGKLTYMTCDDTSCLPPADIDFSIALKD